MNLGLMRGHQDGDAFNGHRLGVCVLLLGVGGRREGGGDQKSRGEGAWEKGVGRPGQVTYLS